MLGDGGELRTLENREGEREVKGDRDRANRTANFAVRFNGARKREAMRIQKEGENNRSCLNE